MAQLDDITQKILLEGDHELLEALKKIGEEGGEAIEKISAAAESGAGRLEVLASTLNAIGRAVATATVALLDFVETQNSVTQKTAFLAEAFGTTAQNLQTIEAAFASAGVSAQVFERFANRLTVSIAQQWPEIAESIRTASTQQDEAQERIVAATIRTKEATQSLADNAEDTASRLAAANSRVEKAYVALRFASQQAAAQITHDFEAVSGATLSVANAQQRLDTLLGNPPTEGQKQQLAVEEAQLAVEKARQQQADAQLAQQQHQAEAAQKQKDLEQAAADAVQKRYKEEQEAILRTQQLENARREAATATEAAEERAAKLRTTDIKAITEQLQGIVTSGKDAAEGVDLTNVSVRNLERAVFNLASVGGKAPTGLQATVALSKLLSQATEEQIPHAERLALVQKLSATSIQNTGASTSELLKVLEKGPAEFQKFSDAAQGAFQITDKGVHDVEEFKGAFEGLVQQLSLVQQSFAAALSPVFTELLTTITNSIKSNTGVLHEFVEGVKGIGAAFAFVGEEIAKGFNALASFFNVQPAVLLKAILEGILIVIAAFAPLLIAIPALIAVIVTNVGKVYENFEAVKKAVSDAWEAIKDSAVVRFVQNLIDLVSKLASLFSGIKGLFSAGNSNPTNDAPNVPGAAGQNALAGGTSTVVPGLSLASGGEVHGPGSTTSDSIFAKLSRGEFVVKAAAVQAYGANLFHQLNSMTFPGFAAGGLVPSPVRLPGSGSLPATSVLNLSIDGRSFNGLRGPKTTIDDLSSFAISRQTSAAGNNPSWMK